MMTIIKKWENNHRPEELQNKKVVLAKTSHEMEVKTNDLGVINWVNRNSGWGLEYLNITRQCLKSR